MSARAKVNLDLTSRALLDLVDIQSYSIAQWGKQTAEKYLRDIQAGLQRIIAHPELLAPHPEFESGLKFYRVKKHLIVCDVQLNSVVVITIAHASMDLESQVAKLQPTLAGEIQLLHSRLRSS